MNVCRPRGPMSLLVQTVVVGQMFSIGTDGETLLCFDTFQFRSVKIVVSWTKGPFGFPLRFCTLHRHTIGLRLLVRER